MKELRFSTPLIDSLQFEKTGKFVSDKDYSVDLKISKSQVYNTGEEEFFYGIKLDISGKEVPFKLKMSISANFFLDLDEAEDVKSILEDKGTGILISYARPIVAEITMHSGFAPLDLPFINV